MEKKAKVEEMEELRMEPLVDLLSKQDDQMKDLFTKMINLFVAPGADQIDEKEKEDRLRQAIEDSLT